MKKACISFLLASLVLTGAILLSWKNDRQQGIPTYALMDSPIHVPPSRQRIGNSTKGYQYLTEGDYLKSGIPFDIFSMVYGKDKANYLIRSGSNTTIPYNFTAVKADNGAAIVVPNCMQCHAQVWGDSLIIGLGNSQLDFTRNQKFNAQTLKAVMRTFAGKRSADFEASASFIRVTSIVAPDLLTAVKGVNTADRLASLLAAHRNPITFRWSDTPMLDVPRIVAPSDVPAWWLLKKKNAMFYNGFGRGDFGRFLMASNLLTVMDTAEAAIVDSHIQDVLAYLLTLQPPKFPKPIQQQTARQGQRVFSVYCAKCHGSYGPDSKYPNLLIPESIVGTDSLLFKSNYQNPQFINWFNNSWFASGNHPAQLVPFNGYIAPPLDGIWITAPYFHNGSVPTLEAVLNSRLRPTYWNRFYTAQPEYDYDRIGWKYELHFNAGGSTVYNTTLPGYGNYGHTFGDKLTEEERREVIEYLKTL